MYYLGTLPEPQAAIPLQPPPQPPPPPQSAGINIHILESPQTARQNYTVSLQHQQQPFYHSPYPINPVLSNSRYNYIPIQPDPCVNDPYAPHVGYAYSAYPFADAGTSARAFGVTVDGVHGYGPVDSRAISANEASRQCGARTVSYIAASPNCFVADMPPYQNTSSQPGSENTRKKSSKKISKIAQSAYCAVCRLDCNSQDALKSHKQGKKHKKNLQKLQDSITPKPREVGEHESGESRRKKKKRKAALAENEFDLETKKTRVLEAGGSADEVRVCSICKVVSNSRKVYNDHLAGQKHAAMEKRLQEAAAT